MLIKSISFPTYFEGIPDIEDSNINVFVELEDGYSCSVIVGTAKNIEYLMNKEKMNYFEPGDPFIIVKELTKDIIKEAVQAYAENDDGYWLKLHHFAGRIDKTVFDKLQAEDEAEAEYEEFLEKFDKLYEKYLQKLDGLDKNVNEIDKKQKSSGAKKTLKNPKDIKDLLDELSLDL